MNLAEATRIAAAEGLALVKSSRSATGYSHVYHDQNARFKVHVWENGKERHLTGSLVSVFDGALAYARYLGERSVEVAAAADLAVMTAQDACQMAQEEGLTLVRASVASGFKGVKYYASGRQARPYQALLCTGGGRKTDLGYYATAEEAALVLSLIHI